MKKYLLIILTGVFALTINANAQWVGINSSKEVPADVNLISSTAKSIQVKFTIAGYNKIPLSTPNGKAYKIQVEEGTAILEKGAPDLPKLTASLAIPATDEMAVRVISQKYTDITGIEIAPSKGNFTRDIDPATVPYTYGKAYSQDAFFPGKPAQLREPYILRDVRGQALVVYPFQYNPKTKTLRVLTEILVEVYSTGNTGFNTLSQNQPSSISREFAEIYATHFLNYNSAKYTPLQDEGNMLIISHGAYMSEMQDFVNWKNISGIPTVMVDVATIGVNSSSIKAYVDSYYNTNGLTFLLLVGDAQYVPTMTTSNGHSDNAYGYISGNDHYPEVFVGRFSAENAQDVQTQVMRTLMYERDATVNDYHYSTNIGIASSQGPGDDNEMDYQHIRNMQTDLMAYTYNTSLEYFDGSQGGNDAPGNPSSGQVATGVNGGSGLILYTGHGSSTSWSSSGFSNSSISSLTNNGMFPFIWSVACVNGNFVGNTCFAEAWMRARTGDQPKGAIATLMSTINQSWDPPMEGQDEMVDILVESYNDNIKRTFGGLSMNGCMKMNDTYGSGGDEMTDTWNLFGDPSLMVRTDTPQVIAASYQNPILLGSAQLSVSCPVDSALVTLSHNGQILDSKKASNGSANLNFPTLSSLDSLQLVITAYNHIPHMATLQVIPANGPYVIYSHSAVSDPTGNQNGQADFGEAIDLNVALRNMGVALAGQVTATLSTTDPMVSITAGSNTWGNINAGDTMMLQAAFGLDINNGVADQHNVMFDVDVADTAGNAWSSSMSMTVNAPSLSLKDMLVDDAAGGNGNNVLEPGETAILTVPVQNAGHADALATDIMLVSANPLAVIDTMIKSVSGLSQGSITQLTYMISVDTAFPLGSSLALHASVTSGMYSANRVYYMAIGEVNEDFETGDFTKFNWTFGGTANWVIDASFPYEGSYCAESGNIGNSSSTSLEITLDVLTNDTISFYRKVSSESGYDFFSFYIDGDLKEEWSGNVTWAKVSYPVSAGTHTFKWEYAKDWYVSSGSDCAWLDYIEFPPIALGSAPLGVTAVANPATYCEGGSTQLSSFVNGGSGTYTYSWTPTTGLSDPTIANPVADPATTTQYTLTVNDGTANVSAMVDVVVKPRPATPLISQQGNDLVSDASAGNQWYDSNGPISGANGQSYTPSVTEDYYVIVTNTQACESMPSNVINFVVSGIDEHGLSGIELWPNPAKGSITISYLNQASNMVKISVLDLLGQEVEVLSEGLEAAGEQQHSYMIGHIPAGVYLVRLDLGDQVKVIRLIKE